MPAKKRLTRSQYVDHLFECGLDQDMLKGLRDILGTFNCPDKDSRIALENILTELEWILDEYRSEIAKYIYGIQKETLSDHNWREYDPRYDSEKKKKKKKSS